MGNKLAHKVSMCTKECVTKHVSRSIIMHVKHPKLSIVMFGLCALLADFCLSLYILHVLNRDVDIIQSIYMI